MRKGRVAKRNINDLFLNRTLSYNQTFTESPISEYYLHTITKKNLTKDNLVTIIRDFQLTRKKEEETHLVYVNNLNLKSVLIELDERDYFVSLLACIICKHSFKNISALIIHYYFVHYEYEYNQTKINNPHTNLIETHIFLSTNKKDLIDDSSSNSKILTIISNSFTKFKNALKVISSLDISKLSSQSPVIDLFSKKKGSIPKSEFRLKKYKFENDIEHLFFHVYTGEIVDPYDPTMDYVSYDMDYDYIEYLENKEIDKQINTSEKQKHFFKIWNKYISDSGIIANNKLESHILEFIKSNANELISLKVEFFVHLKTLYDYSLLSKNQLINILLVIFNNCRITGVEPNE